jgi:hypothetical protein
MCRLIGHHSEEHIRSRIMDLWAYHNQVRIDSSRPGKPTDNAHVESFNGTLRAECLDVHWFGTLVEAKQIIESWRYEYSESRPHRALGERTPSEFACQIALKGRFDGLTNRRKLALKVCQKKENDRSRNRALHFYAQWATQVFARTAAWCLSRMPRLQSVEGPWGLGYTPHHERLSCASVPDQQTEISRLPVKTMAGRFTAEYS